MKILYITAKTPWSKEESFILEELNEIKKINNDLLIIPRSPEKNIFHKKAKKLEKISIWLPLINWKIFIFFLKKLFLNKIYLKTFIKIITKSRNISIIIKNIIVFPKAIFIASNFCQDVEHIHAHWGSTPSTMAYIISEVTKITWSLTLHRWDIKENNLLKEKIKSTKFIRCISEHGKNELIEIIGNKYLDKIKVIHLGIQMKEEENNKMIKKYLKNNIFKIITPGHFLEVKGHEYLIKSCSLLIKNNIKNFHCFFYGHGQLKKNLKKMINRYNLNDFISIKNTIPQEKLFYKYKNKKIDLIVMPSINTKDQQHEGIPVSLMEAMAYKIPAISTNTGGIPELLSNNAGIIIEEKNPEKLAEAIKNIIQDEKLYFKISETGYFKILKEFNIEKNIKRLLDLFKINNTFNL